MSCKLEAVSEKKAISCKPEAVSGVTGKYQPYPEYQRHESGLLDSLPNDWTETKIGYVTKKIGSGKTPSGGANTYVDEGIMFLRSQNVYDDGLRLDDVVRISENVDAEMIISRVSVGDILLNITGASIGRTCRVPEGFKQANVNQHVCIIRTINPRDSEFLAWVMKSFIIKGQVENAQTGAAREGLNFEQISNFRFAMPPHSEQRTIIAFLDHETARIDALIAKQRRLIALLKEKIISLALSTDGTEKIEQVRLGYAADLILRPVHQKEQELYTPIGLYNRGRGLFHKEPREMEDMGESDFFWIKEGDLIISGQFAWEGSVALAGKAETGCVVSHRYPVLRGKKCVALTEYLYALLITRHGDFLLNQNSRGAAGRNRPLNINSLLKEEIPLPPLKVQKEVATAVHWRVNVQKKIEQQILLLEERRTALISAAVTGKIDLRSWQPPTGASGAG